MDTKSKQSILRQLAKKGDDAAMKAIEKEMDKISLILTSSSNYDEISDGLEVMDVFAYRVHFKAVTAIKDFLKRTNDLNLTYEEIRGYPTEARAKFYTKDKLIIRALKVLERIRYHEPERIMDLLFQYCNHEKEEVSKTAQECLVEYAKYHLDIFYGDGKSWSGLGPQPQEKLIDKILSFSAKEKRNFLPTIKILCKEILSPSITGTSSTYKTVTFTTASISAMTEVKVIRRRALEVLENLYIYADSPKQKKSIIGAMRESTLTPGQSAYGDKVFSMILDDTIAVLEFIRRILKDNENLEVVQSIEHETYYMFRRGTTKKDVFAEQEGKIQALALAIKDLIDQNEEYQIFKILIGFNGIFAEWKTKDEDTDARDIENERRIRNDKSREFANIITDQNFPVWKRRILEYAKIESNDLAMFPYFGKFLQHFSKINPKLSINLLSEEHKNLEPFLVALLAGLWEGAGKDEAEKIVLQWINEDRYLFSIARFIGFLEQPDESLLEKVFEAARRSGDVSTLMQVISSIAAQYNNKNLKLIDTILIPAIEELTKNSNSNWVYDFWFRNEKREIFASMSREGHEVILRNLLLANKISYQHEEVLAEIARQVPDSVIKFFCERIEIDKRFDNKEFSYEDRYEAVPFSLSASLSGQLSKIPNQAIQIVFDQYDGNYSSFMFRGAKLLSNIFADFPSEFSQKLIELVRQNTKNTNMFVLGILRNYEGDARIQTVCKELVKILPENDALIDEVMVALESTGVVSGEYGLAEAYEAKILEISPWLKDQDNRVKDFAKKYIEILKKRIEFERKRSDEQIALMKYEYGDDTANKEE